MSNKYSVRVGRDGDFVKGYGVQQMEFGQTLEKVQPFQIYADHGALTNFVEMGMTAEIYLGNERIFKGIVLDYEEDDKGLMMGGSDLMVRWANVFCDLQYTVSTKLETLIYDLMHSSSSKRHVDDVDAMTYVKPTNLERKWLLTDKQLSSLLKDLVRSSQDTGGNRINTFWLDPYDYLHVEPFGGSIYTGHIDTQKSKIGARIDGDFCNYAVMRGHRAIPEPANRDVWTENNASDWTASSGVASLGDSNQAKVNAMSLIMTGSAATTHEFYLVIATTGQERNLAEADYVSFWFQPDDFAAGTLNLSSSFFGLYEGGVLRKRAYFDDNVQGHTSFTDDTWYYLRIPLTDVAGTADQITRVHFTLVWTVSGTHRSFIDGLHVEKSEPVSKAWDEMSIRTFGLFEKRKRDTKLMNTDETLEHAGGMLSQYPKFKYNVSANGYVPIDLNQVIRVLWKRILWSLPLTKKKVVFNGIVTTTQLTFGGLPVQVNDQAVAMAAETRAESYGKIVRHKKELGAGDDDEAFGSIETSDGVTDFSDTESFIDPDLPIDDYGGRSSTLITTSFQGVEKWKWSDLVITP